MRVHDTGPCPCPCPHPVLCTAAGRVLRAATTWCRLVGCDTLPPLLPSSALTLCLDEQEWAAALAAPAAVLPGGGAVYTPAQLVAGGTAALGSSGCPLNGWLHAEVVALGQESIGAGCPDAAASRCAAHTLPSCICMLPARPSSSSSSSPPPAHSIVFLYHTALSRLPSLRCGLTAAAAAVTLCVALTGPSPQELVDPQCAAA